MILIKQIGSILADLLFPRLCLHCQEPLDAGHLCRYCSEKIELSDLCQDHLTSRTLYTCEHIGPCVDLARYANSPKIAKNIAALMVIQLCRYRQDLPGALFPIQTSSNDATAIASNMGALLDIKLRPALSVSQRLLRKWPKSRKLHKEDLKLFSSVAVSLYGLKKKEKESIIKQAGSLGIHDIFFISFLP